MVPSDINLPETSFGREEVIKAAKYCTLPISTATISVWFTKKSKRAFHDLIAIIFLFEILERGMKNLSMKGKEDTDIFLEHINF